MFVDLTAAYDTAWHRGLTCKLLRLLPDKHMVRMIMELVRNRSFSLTIGDSKRSRLRRLKNGVPQESVLASLLFNIYVYDLPSTISRRYASADDLALLYSSDDWKDLEGVLSQDMTTISTYLQTWRLQLSHTKTVMTAFHLNTVTGCLRPTPTDYLPIIAGIQLAELCQLGATFSLAYRGNLDPGHILHELLAGSPDGYRERLKSRRPFVPAAWKLLQDLTESDICAAQWTDFKWSTEYSECSSDLCAFIPRTSTRPMGMGLPRSSWVRLNRLRAGVGWFQSFMHK